MSLDIDPEAGRRFVDEHRLEVGHVLPLSKTIFDEYFPSDQSFLLSRNKRVSGVFSYRSGRDKQIPTGVFRATADTPAHLKEMVSEIEKVALAEEKMVLRTSVFGYDSKKSETLKALSYRVGASLPGTVSLEGRRYDYHILYKELKGRYRFKVERSYVRAGLYPTREVLKVKNPDLKIRGYRKEDRPILDLFAVDEMVIRGIASGVFGGSYPWVRGTYDQMVESGRLTPIVCEDETKGEPVAILDLWRSPTQVMRHASGLGMFVRPEYQGIGVGTMLMKSMKSLAMRLHLTRVWLSVFNGNVPAQRLYQKTGFEECGRIPGWLQEGYVDEVFMTLRLD